MLQSMGRRAELQQQLGAVAEECQARLRQVEQAKDQELQLLRQRCQEALETQERRFLAEVSDLRRQLEDERSTRSAERYHVEALQRSLKHLREEAEGRPTEEELARLRTAPAALRQHLSTVEAELRATKRQAEQATQEKQKLQEKLRKSERQLEKATGRRARPRAAPRLRPRALATQPPAPGPAGAAAPALGAEEGYAMPMETWNQERRESWSAERPPEGLGDWGQAEGATLDGALQPTGSVQRTAQTGIQHHPAPMPKTEKFGPHDRGCWLYAPARFFAHGPLMVSESVVPPSPDAWSFDPGSQEEGAPACPVTNAVHPGREKNLHLGERTQRETFEAETYSSVQEEGAGYSANLLEAWRLVIRPPRRRYDPKILGPDKLQVILPSPEAVKRLSRPLERHDMELQNSQGLTLRCSHFRSNDSPAERLPCVIFCHGSSSCRVDAFQVMPWLFEYKLTVFAFDFAGSGLSDGEYVTLGYREEDDLRVIIDYLLKTNTVSSIGLWGKSMGAVASLLRASKDRRVDACVLDSPYADFQKVVLDYFDSTVALQWVPGALLDFCLSRVSSAVRQRVGLDPREMQPKKAAPFCHCPALFAVAEDDRVVQPHQVRELQAAWGGASRFCSFQGGHNSDRPPSFYREAAHFMWESLQQAAESDALLCGAVDAYLQSEACDRSGRFSLDVERPLIKEDDLLRNAVECYLDQRDCLDEAIDHFLRGGGSALPSWSPRWPHLTQGHVVRPLHLMSQEGRLMMARPSENSALFSV
ncbi:unnamed protein product [Effrenium voratum]|nr:unnamed protein product [Effrenium voratum]